MKRLAVAVLVVSLAGAAPASAQFYKYLDKQGQVRFTDDINQVPENQRKSVRSYESSMANSPEASISGGGVENKAAASDTVANSNPETADAAAPEGELIDTEKMRLEALKKQIDADYQALVKEKETLSKEKEQAKSREQVVEYNKRAESFNKKSGELEARSNELRKQVETYNAHVIEENAKMIQSAKK